MKDSLFLDICRNDYRAVFQMLRRTIKLCPDSLWDARTDEPPFWQQAYHTIWAIDFYLHDSPRAHRKPSFAEEDATNLEHVPTSTPSIRQIQDYLEEVAEKCERVLNEVVPGQLEGENRFHWTGPTFAYRMTYNVRHAQHHVGWLNSMLSRKAGKAAEWVISAGKPGS